MILTMILGTAALATCRTVEEAVNRVERSDSTGVTIVHNHGPQWGAGEAWSVAREPVVTIGVWDGPEEYQLFGVAAAARLSDGGIVVVEGGSGWSNLSAVPEARLYDADGDFLKTLGGAGSGPGEFLNPDHVLVTEGDTISVWDQGTLRITRFTGTGDFIDAETVDLGRIVKAIDPPLYPGTVRLLTGGSLLVRLIEKAVKAKASAGQNAPQGVFRERSGALRAPLDGSGVDTLMFFGGTEQISVDAPWGRRWNVVPPAARKTVVAVQPTSSKVCIGDQEGTEITCFGPDGSRTVIRWYGKPVALVSDDIAEWRDTTIELFTQKMNEADALRVLDQITIPTFRPAYTRITLDRVGNLWVQTGATSVAGSDSVDHLVFDPQGVLLGSVALPPIDVLEIGHDYVLGVFRDDLEVEYLHLYEILKPPVPTGGQ